MMLTDAMGYKIYLKYNQHKCLRPSTSTTITAAPWRYSLPCWSFVDYSGIKIWHVASSRFKSNRSNYIEITRIWCSICFLYFLCILRQRNQYMCLRKKLNYDTNKNLWSNIIQYNYHGIMQLMDVKEVLTRFI